MQPHDRVNFTWWSLFRKQRVLVPCEQGLLSQLCCSLHSSQRKAYTPFCQALVPIHASKNEAYKCGPSCFSALCLVSWIKEQSNVLSLFRRAFAPFHSFTMLVSTRGEKQRKKQRTVNSLTGLLSASTLHPHPQPQPESRSMIRPENRYSSV